MTIVIPPFARIVAAFAEDCHARILGWALAHEDRFAPASIIDKKSWDTGGRIDPAQRIALVTRDFPEIEDELRARFLALLDAIAEGSGYHGEPPTSLELEIAAHGDGAHFHPHLDIQVGDGRAPLGNRPDEDRVLSAVYYFHRLPRAFSGGELRLFGFEGSGDSAVRPHVDIEPEDNCLVAFPSWIMHQVLPIESPSRRFADSRFSVNCWYCRPTL